MEKKLGIEERKGTISVEIFSTKDLGWKIITVANKDGVIQW